MSAKSCLVFISLSLACLTAAAQQITVSAAASLGNAFIEIGRRFEATRSGVTVRFNFGASGMLLQQIEQGAPADVFASADEDTLRRGIERQRLDAATRRDFAANVLVLVAPNEKNQPVRSLADLQSPAVKRVAIGKPATVPAGRYAQQALASVGLWADLQPRLVHADNVRQVLDYVSRGEVEAGFVYRTDALLFGDRLRVVQALAGHDPVRYPAVVVSDSRHKALAADFVNFLMAPPAQEVLQRYGFGRP